MMRSSTWMIPGCCLLVAVAANAVEAQTPPDECTRRTCVLSIHWSPWTWLFWDRWVERGDSGQVVGSLDDSDYFRRVLTTTEETSGYYEDFLTSDRWSDALRYLGVAAMLTGVGAEILTDQHSGWPGAVLAGGFYLRLASEIPGWMARRAFSRAADVYNRTLPPP